ncbi:DUF6502 family protein [Thioalkalivibrio sp. XN8]|uniref:DUF6502 family protein n=1 Tax=Thioalkalivibrio sp. XN8 TaxID=2712863 RepID=UPI0013EAF03F|nr:DUF6502 family protein [Thioalkalivibrio sp. XN8]NGP54412.1 hypothetical protein [Thioalkalivibrio sp. XN8]
MSNDDFKSAIVEAASRALRPLARMLLASGLTFREFNALARRVFVSVATDEFGRGGRPTNVSRVSLMTGIARKEVKKLRDELAQQDPPAPALRKTTEATRVLSAWHESPGYQDADGAPLAIPREGPAPSFAALHHEHGGDIPASTLEKDLVRTGAVGIGEDGRLRALTRYFMPLPLEADAVDRAGDVLMAMGNTVTRNLTRKPGSVGRFEGRATHPQIPARAEAEFRQFLETEGMRFLEAMDRWLLQHAPQSPHEAKDAIRLGVGVYQITEPPESGTPAPPAKPNS